MRISIIHICLTVLAAITFTCKKGGGGGGTEWVEDLPEEVPSPIKKFDDPDPETTTEVVKNEVNFGLTRVTPEQFSRNLQKILGLETNYLGTGVIEPYSGRQPDYILALYAVPLGGIDYVTSIFRDPTTKAQTILISRQLAWQLSAQIVAAEAVTAIGSRHVFKDYDIDGTYERPFMTGDEGQSQGIQDQINAGEVRWKAQVEQMFWSFFSRPPSAEEHDAIRSAFVTVYQNESSDNRRAWAAILYTFLSSQEFWHL